MRKRAPNVLRRVLAASILRTKVIGRASHSDGLLYIVKRAYHPRNAGLEAALRAVVIAANENLHQWVQEPKEHSEVYER